jgi:hypothetical protein
MLLAPTLEQRMTHSTAPDFVREYLSRMADIRGTGGATKETSYYSALENLLNHFGKELRPQVICNGQLRNEGAGNPDFGLYTRNQVQDGEPLKGQLPERGVVEVKGLNEQTWQTADSAQATKYLEHYGLVLITNYREFRLVGKTFGKPVELDKYTIASDEAAFWAMTSTPASVARRHGLHLGEFIRRVLLTSAPLVKAEDIAWFLASYAKDALATLNDKDATNLKPLRDALEASLGITFEGDQGEHFQIDSDPDPFLRRVLRLGCACKAQTNPFRLADFSFHPYCSNGQGAFRADRHTE